MKLDDELSDLKPELILSGNSISDLDLKFRILSLVLTKDQCFITLEAKSETYQFIDSQSLFNLKPEIRGPISGGQFKPYFDIQIESILEPSWLEKLAKKASNAEEAATYLRKISQEDPDHPVLSAYSWYALEVRQQQESRTVGYRTLWYYLNPTDITPNGIDPEKISQAMLNFTEEWRRVNGQSTTYTSTSSDSQPSPEDLISQSIQELTQTFENLSQELTTSTEEVVSETVQEMTQAFTELSTSFSEIAEEIEELTPETSIYETIIDFFKADSWPIQTFPDQSIVRFAFQGKNSKLDGYAKARQNQKQAVVYSIYPNPIPEEQRFAVAEFITRANYGMILGNFELDYSDGEIRYKTSIDVENDRLTPALIQNLVYTNVMTMDQYLPGLLAVIETGLGAEAAIALIEQP